MPGTYADAQYPSPEAAEAAFYRAFENRDAGAMEALWLNDAGVACIHPLAAPLTGYQAVIAGWRGLFEGAGRFRVRAELLATLAESDMVIRVVHEHLTLGNESASRPPILATNAYRKTSAGWRMVLHHASPLPTDEDRVQAAAARRLH